MTDPVNHPPHYNQYPFEVIEIIKFVLNKSKDEITPFQAYCLGNELKYRLRAGFKDPKKIKEDVDKALFYYNFRKKS